jgi:agmatinase
MTKEARSSKSDARIRISDFGFRHSFVIRHLSFVILAAMPADPTQFLGLPSPGQERADALLLPLPVEKTVSYGRGTGRGPQAIIAASLQVEMFDEETLVDFAESPRIHALPAVSADGEIEECLARIRDCVRPLARESVAQPPSAVQEQPAQPPSVVQEQPAQPRAAVLQTVGLREKFLVALGGEHTVTYGVVTGLVDDPAEVTVVQIDAHADLADELHGRHWSHGTVMRRLWERGCRLVQIGIRSLSRAEHELATVCIAERKATIGPRITTFYAHRLDQQWAEVLETLRGLEGKVYLTIDVDGLDPSIIPSTGTPQPGGLSWRQTMDVIRVLTTESRCRLIGADVVEFVPSLAPPGCDPAAARLVAKLLAWWWKGRGSV